MLIVAEALYRGGSFEEVMTDNDLFIYDRKVEQRSYHSTREYISTYENFIRQLAFG